ncbi:T9SS type A sorting domain-containing protein [Psychroserpens luteus]|uniref:T9SS type A sorting domain-containing protein n=1 Tax=Psychroserpens luteus TaxID=1434066 RepID=A0ABW6A200_9FLAO|nr:T9SS type A sorting domain-containing protein [Psychroserpens luteus]
MKKITIMFIIMLAFCLQSNAQDTCATATVVTPGTITGTTITIGTGSAEMAPSGDDSVWFVYTATADGTINVNACLGGADTDLSIGTGTCGALTGVVNNDDSCDLGDGDAYASEIDGYAVVIGADYYIEWSNEWSEGPFDWSLTFTPAPTCTAATIDSSDVTETCNPDGTGTFTVDIVVSDAGDAGSVFNDDTNTYPVVAGIVSAGPYNSGESVTIELVSLDEDCSSTVGTFTFTCPQPAPDNDECSGAITIACDGQYVGDTTNATPEDEDPGQCTTSAGTAGAVWYTFIGANSNDAGAAAGSVGDDVTLDLSLSTFDTKIRVFSGVCGDLTCVAGDDDGGTGNTSLVTIPSIVGTEYYVLVHGFSANAGTYTLDVSCVAPPTCTAATIDSADEVETCNPDGTGTFTVDIVVSDAGDAGSVFDDGTNTYPVIAGTVSAGPYNSGESVTIEFVSLDEDCSFTVGTFSFTCPQPAPANDNCDGALALECGVTITGTTDGATASGLDTTCGSFGSTDGRDLFYTFDADGVSSYTVSLDQPAGSFALDGVVIVYSGLCNDLTNIDCDDSGNPEAVTLDTPAAGTYTVRIFDYTGVADFTLDLTCTAPPACTAATIDSSTVVESCNPDGTGTFTVDIVVSDAGDAGSVFDDGTNTYPVVAGTVLAGPYNSGDSVTIELISLDEDCSSTVGTFEFTCPPPAPDNDDVAEAINIPVGNTVCETIVIGTNVGATDTVENDNEADCGSFNPAGDVWFKVVVPSTGEVTIETSAADDNPIADTLMTVYSGASGSLVEIGCSDDDGVSFFSLIELTGLTAGDILLVRVWEYQDNLKGNFNICAWSPSTLGLADNTFNEFAYYPNPVKDVLTLESPNAIDKIEVFNVLGQRIVAIDSQNTIQKIDLSNVQTGAYFVKVSIGNQIKIIRVIKE